MVSYLMQPFHVDQKIHLWLSLHSGILFLLFIGLFMHLREDHHCSFLLSMVTGNTCSYVVKLARSLVYVFPFSAGKVNKLVLYLPCLHSSWNSL